ncbi:hypothetical protein N431DRAFT_360479 [Stipitochalara longipes BDJ]|nr:hypothetical protein N431DRAFT_360479 [Stipitochalara longipes BDJ]
MSLAFTPRFLHIGRLALPVTLLILVFYFTLSPSRSSSTPSFSFGFSSFTSSGRKSAFISAAVETEIDGPFDNSTLIELCASRTWTEGLIFKCEVHGDGIVEARNVVLNCLRFGIEAGATNFIIPEIILTGATGTAPTVPFSHLFDLSYFTSTLSSSCPQITIIPHINALWDKPSTSPALSISPNHFPSKPHLALLHNSILAKPENWTSAFKLHLNATHPRPPTSQLPVLVKLFPPPLLQFPMSYDSPHFIANFGKLVRTNEELRKIAGTVLYAFSQQDNLGVRPERGIERGKYYSAAFPSSDAKVEEVVTGIPNPKAVKSMPLDELSNNFITGAERLNLTAIYLATPQSLDPASIEAFAAKGEVEKFVKVAANHSLSLATAEDLLGGPLPLPYLSDDPEPTLLHPERHGAKGFEGEWQQYKALTAAQKEAVDYEVLIRGTQFGGSSLSALSWGVALRRHVISSGGAGKWRALVDGEVSAKAVGGTKAGRRERKKKIVGEDPEVDRATAAQDRKMAPKPRPLSKERSFRDELSVLFGGRGEGAAWELGGWP